MSYRQQFYSIPKTNVGDSFRDLINNDDIIQDRRCLLANLKNVARQYFYHQNILALNCTDSTGRIRYINEMISRPWGMKGPDRMWCEGIAIPLRSREPNVHSELELCVAGGNGQLWSTKPTVGLRYKSAADNSWSAIRWFGTREALWLQLRHDAQFREVTPLTEGSIDGHDIKAHPIMLGLYPHTSHVGDLYAAAAENADQLVKFFSPEDRIDFTKVQLAMGIGFKKTSTPEITASMVALGIRTMCSRCLARYGTEGDPKRINFLQAELDDPANPWLPGSTKQESYLWIIDYILNTVGTCDDAAIAKQLTDGIGATMLDELSRVVENDPTPDRTLLIVNLRTAK